ncbi:MAG TPA: tetraacyldisaccharide 4'-kinase, partial [Gammaproteobacteria bacterium]
MQFRDEKQTDAKTPAARPRIIRSSVLNKTLLSHWVSLSTQRRQGWWLWSMNPLSILLMPLSMLFLVFVKLRLTAYRLRLLRSRRPPVTTVVVGNITLGGNGKTPIVIALYH